MILYSDRDDHYSQRVRIVLAEKDISAEINETKPEETSDEILSISPYHKLPILVDRDLAIHDPSVMMEYLDERFPHPPLLPVYPVARANCRTLMLRIDREWCPLIDTLIDGQKSEKEMLKIREELLHEISSIAPTFKEFKFFMNDEFTLVACCFAPILWRLPSVGIKLPGIEYDIQKEEAAYRKELVLGEDFKESAQPVKIDHLYGGVRKIHYKMYFHYLYFNSVKWSYLQGMVIVPYLALAPTIVTGAITLGFVQQIIRAFGRVETSLQYLVRSWPIIVELISVWKRLSEFENKLKANTEQISEEKI